MDFLSPTIKYTSIINSFVSTEGGGGFMTNYVYYSILVVYKDGRKEIVEGKKEDILPLLIFLRTPQDSVQAIEEELKTQVIMMRSSIADVYSAITAVKEEQRKKFELVLDTLCPIPNLNDLNEVNAIEQLLACDLIPVFVNTYSPSTPKTGIVKQYWRSDENFKAVCLDIRHVLPDLVGMAVDNAVSILEDEGFTYDIEKKIVYDAPDGTIISCTRINDLDLNVHLVVNQHLPDLRCMEYMLATDEIEKVGYTSSVSWAFSDTYEKDTVISWQIIAGKKIILTVSRGAVPKSEPIITTKTKADENTNIIKQYICTSCQMKMDEYYSTCPYCGTPGSLQKE